MPKVGQVTTVPPYTIHEGDTLKVLPKLPAAFADAVICDPPYGFGFMGKNWDHGVPGTPFWELIKRAAKPGAHLLAFGGTRTFHRLTVAIEDAGWEIIDCIMWVYGSGFPKSLDVSKAIDGVYGENRPRIAGGQQGNNQILGNRKSGEAISGEAISGEAIKWQGWGTALKPAWEPIILARKALNTPNVAENVLRYGTGGINVDGCRVGTDEYLGRPVGQPVNSYEWSKSENPLKGQVTSEPTGRFPANLIHDGSTEVVGMFPQTGKSTGGKGEASALMDGEIYGGYSGNNKGGNAGGLGDSGSAARFFYAAKASKRDRDEGLESFAEVATAAMQGNLVSGQRLAGNGTPIATPKRSNNHPTVKPTSLMQYLCRLVTPPGGLILDPFMGSGSTGKAAMYEGFRFTGIEMEAEYVKIAKARIDHAYRNRKK